MAAQKRKGFTPFEIALKAAILHRLDDPGSKAKTEMDPQLRKMMPAGPPRKRVEDMTAPAVPDATRAKRKPRRG